MSKTNNVSKNLMDDLMYLLAWKNWFAVLFLAFLC